MSGKYAYIGDPILHRSNGFVAGPLLEVELDLRVSLCKGTEVLGKEGDDRRGVGMNANVSARALTVLTELRLEAGGILENAPGMEQKGMAGRGQLDPAGTPIEKLGTEL